MRASWPVHPFLVGLFPVLSLYAHNVYESSLRELVLPVAAVYAVTLGLIAVIALALRSWQKSALIVSLFLILFFATNHVNQLLNKGLTELSRYYVHRQVEVRPAHLLAAEVLLLAAAAFWVTRALRRLNELTRFLNVFSLILIGLPITNAVMAINQPPPPDAIPAERPRPSTTVPVPHLARPQSLPDIYYIILDGYARSDKMRELFGFNNQPFLNQLKQRGFYIADQSHSNYCQTPLSLASSLNFQYLDDLTVEDPLAIQDCLRDRICNNAIMKALKPLGYQSVSFATGFDPTENPEADMYYTPHARLTGFQWMLLSTTPLANLATRFTTTNPYALARERTRFLLKKLPEVTANRAPTFAFAHIVCPHPPFVFGANGEDVSPHGKLFQLTDGDQFQLIYGDRDDYIYGYRDQAIFITREVVAMIDRILSRSPEPPIILLQSDHGSGLGLNIFFSVQTDLPERMSILNAFHLPGKGADHLYDTITPVNSFRVVLNEYFGARLDLLPDRSYYSTWPSPMKFLDVTGDVSKPPAQATPPPRP